MSLPYMKFYIGDYLKDTIRLTTHEHGAYLLILMEMWNQDGELPLDHEALAKIARVDRRRWPKVWDRIGVYFLFGAGMISHKRINQELDKSAAASSRRSSAGRRGGFSKALKDKGARLAMPQQTHGILESESYKTPAPEVRGAVSSAPNVVPIGPKKGA